MPPRLRRVSRGILVAAGSLIIVAGLVVASVVLKQLGGARHSQVRLVTLHNDTVNFVNVALIPGALNDFLRYAAKPDDESFRQMNMRKSQGLLFPVENGTTAEVIDDHEITEDGPVMKLMLTSGPYRRTIVYCPRAVVR
jgi:hypothetical protein